MSDRQYTYTWEKGSPEMEAHLRNLNGKASIDDLLLLAEANMRSADEALPPHALAPGVNNSGESWTPDPWHASACAERAEAYVRRVRALIAAYGMPDASAAKKGDGHE